MKEQNSKIKTTQIDHNLSKYIFENDKNNRGENQNLEELFDYLSQSERGRIIELPRWVC